MSDRPIHFLTIDMDLTGYDRWEYPYQIVYQEKAPRWGRPNMPSDDYFVCAPQAKTITIDQTTDIWQPQNNYNRITVCGSDFFFKTENFRNGESDHAFNENWPARRVADAYLLLSLYENKVDNTTSMFHMQELKREVEGNEKPADIRARLKNNLDNIVAKTGIALSDELRDCIDSQVNSYVSPADLLKELNRTAYEEWDYKKDNKPEYRYS